MSSYGPAGRFVCLNRSGSSANWRRGIGLRCHRLGYVHVNAAAASIQSSQRCDSQVDTLMGFEFLELFAIAARDPPRLDAIVTCQLSRRYVLVKTKKKKKPNVMFLESESESPRLV